MRTLITILCTLLAAYTYAARASRRAFTIIDYRIKGLERTDTLVLRWGILNNTVSPLIAEHHAQTHQADTLIIDEPRLLFLSLKGKEGVLELLVQPGEHITVSGRLRRGFAQHYAPCDFSLMHVSGAEAQEEYTQMISHYERYRDSLSRVPDGYREISRRYNDALAVGDIRTIKAMREGTFEEQNYLQMVGSREEEVVRYAMTMVLTYRDTYLAPLLMLRLFSRIDERLRPLYQQFYPEARNTFYGTMVRRQVLPKIHASSVAQPLPVMHADLTPDTLRFDHHRPRLSLLVFWASYCSPCLKHMPVLQSLYTKYHDQGLDIITVSTDADTPEWTRCLERLHLPWPTNYFDYTHLAPSLYHFDGIPYTLLIDPEGMIIATNLHGVELVEYLDTIF